MDVSLVKKEHRQRQLLYRLLLKNILEGESDEQIRFVFGITGIRKRSIKKRLIQLRREVLISEFHTLMAKGYFLNDALDELIAKGWIQKLNKTTQNNRG